MFLVCQLLTILAILSGVHAQNKSFFNLSFPDNPNQTSEPAMLCVYEKFANRNDTVVILVQFGLENNGRIYIGDFDATTPTSTGMWYSYLSEIETLSENFPSASASFCNKGTFSLSSFSNLYVNCEGVGGLPQLIVLEPNGTDLGRDCPSPTLDNTPLASSNFEYVAVYNQAGINYQTNYCYLNDSLSVYSWRSDTGNDFGWGKGISRVDYLTGCTVFQYVYHNLATDFYGYEVLLYCNGAMYSFYKITGSLFFGVTAFNATNNTLFLTSCTAYIDDPNSYAVVISAMPDQLECALGTICCNSARLCTPNPNANTDSGFSLDNQALVSLYPLNISVATFTNSEITVPKLFFSPSSSLEINNSTITVTGVAQFDGTLKITISTENTNFTPIVYDSHTGVFSCVLIEFASNQSSNLSPQIDYAASGLVVYFLQSNSPQNNYQTCTSTTPTTVTPAITIGLAVGIPVVAIIITAILFWKFSDKVLPYRNRKFAHTGVQ